MCTQVPGFSVSNEQEEASVWLMEHRAWSAEAISKGSYRRVKQTARQKHSAVKNVPCLKSMTAFRDLVGTQVFSFTPLAIKMNVFLFVCVCAHTRVFEGDKDRKSHFSYYWRQQGCVLLDVNTFIYILIYIPKNRIFLSVCFFFLFLHPPVQTVSTIFRHPFSGLFDLSGTVDCWFAETRLKIKPQPRRWAFISVTKHIVHVSLVRTCSWKGRPPWTFVNEGMQRKWQVPVFEMSLVFMSDGMQRQPISIRSDNVCHYIYLCFLTVGWLVVVFNCRIAEKQPKGP